MRAVRGLICILFLVAGQKAWAGSKLDYSLWLDTVNRIAQGGLSTVRASMDASQFIGCSMVASNGSAYAACAARSGNTYVSCYTYDAGMIKAIGAVNGDSVIRFEYDANSQCTHVEIANYSYTAPKQP